MATPGTQGTPAAAPGVDRAAVQHAAVAVGIAFVMIGVLGFIPGITTNFDALAFAGHHSEAELFGLFNVSVLHNIVHLVFGVLGVALAKTFKAARGYLVVGGGIYLLLAVYGLVVAHASGANVVPVNTADNWLHLALAAGMLALGLVLGRTPDVPRDMRHV
jgi:hypothetical protein